MKGVIANTDFGWYQRLRERPELDEVNFWKPSAGRVFRAEKFTPILFRLKAPHSAICGFGYFSRYSVLPDWLAWHTFGPGNGCENLAEMRDRISAIRMGWPGSEPDLVLPFQIGCILIVQPVLFPPDSWVADPDDWPIRTQSYKTYDLESGEGARVWLDCLRTAFAEKVTITDRPVTRYGTPVLVAPRLGQGTFRIEVLEAYQRQCAITGEHSLPALEAVHIRPYGREGPHDVRNGLLVRADFHRLFDTGYVTVDADMRLVVGKRLSEDFQNGRSYYPLHGSPLQLPRDPRHYPGRDFLAWHRDNVFVG